MILAGIDEAGYGPLLGPLVVGCCAFEFEGNPTAALPCLWERLHKVVGKTRHKQGRKLHINDSKQVYSPSTGLSELERSVLAVTATMSRWPENLDDFIRITAAHCINDLAEHIWYRPALLEPFPLEQASASVKVLANGLKAEMDRTGTRCVHLAARILPERQYNRMVTNTRNKASVLFSTAAMHLDQLLSLHGKSGLVIVCDRQGGREKYGALLRLMFDQWALEVVEEKDGRSEYLLIKDGHAARIFFREKAEEGSLPVAMASMLSKYLRESLMRRFNAYWKTHLPDLSPTAGYYSDGVRFLGDIRSKRDELGISDEWLVRCK